MLFIAARLFADFVIAQILARKLEKNIRDANYQIKFRDDRIELLTEKNKSLNKELEELKRLCPPSYRDNANAH